MCFFIDTADRDAHYAFLSFWQPPFDYYSSTAPAYHDFRVPFHFQNNQSPHHICPKASWVLVYPGVESCSFTGAWAGRCVIAHLDDCWRLFRRSRASSNRHGTADIVEQVRWRLVVSAFGLGAWYTNASTLVSGPLIYASSKSQHFIFIRRSILVSTPPLDRSISFSTATLYLCQMPIFKLQCELVSSKSSKAVYARMLIISLTKSLVSCSPNPCNSPIYAPPFYNLDPVLYVSHPAYCFVGANFELLVTYQSLDLFPHSIFISISLYVVRPFFHRRDL